MTKAPTMSTGDLEVLMAGLVENELILNRDIPPAAGAARIVDGMDATIYAELSRGVLLDLFGSKLRAARRKQIRTTRPKLPGFEHLPVWIIGKRGRRIRLLKANPTDLRDYRKLLSQKYKDRKADNPKFEELDKLLKAMRQQEPDNRGITVAEVLGIAEKG
jgi:hypothetical protein